MAANFVFRPPPQPQVRRPTVPIPNAATQVDDPPRHVPQPDAILLAWRKTWGPIPIQRITFPWPSVAAPPDDPPRLQPQPPAIMAWWNTPIAVQLKGAAPPIDIAQVDDPPRLGRFPIERVLAWFKPPVPQPARETFPWPTATVPPDDPPRVQPFPMQIIRAWVQSVVRTPMPPRPMVVQGIVPHPVIVLNPTALFFTATTGGSNPASQPVTISNGGDGTVTPTLGAITENQGSGWLGGSVSNPTLTVTITLGALAQGVYTGTVNVNSVGADNTPQSVAVTLTVSDPTTPGDPPRSQHGLVSRFSRF